MIVRKATSQDALGIKKVHIQTHQYSYRGFLPDDILDGMILDDDVVKRTAERIKTHDYFIAIEGDDVLAFVSIAYPEDKIVEIEAFYVLPSFQKKGVGTRMLDCIYKLKIAEGFEKIIAWTLKDGPSIGFYKKDGFYQIEGAEKIWKFDLPIIKFMKDLR